MKAIFASKRYYIFVIFSIKQKTCRHNWIVNLTLIIFCVIISVTIIPTIMLRKYIYLLHRLYNFKLFSQLVMFFVHKMEINIQKIKISLQETKLNVQQIKMRDYILNFYFPFMKPNFNFSKSMIIIYNKNQSSFYENEWSIYRN